MVTNLLNLDTYSIKKLEQNEHDYHVYAVVSSDVKHCPHCQSSRIRGFGRREQMVKDISMHGKRVGIYVETRRYQCLGCNSTFYEKLPEIDEKRKMTKRLVCWVGKQAVYRTFSSIADEIGIAEGTVRSIFRDFVISREDEVKFETPEWLGIDEIHLIKARCVITNVQDKTVVEILKDRNKRTVIDYLSRAPNLEKVKYVAMDMWRPYRDAVELLIPDALIVIDKFHVVRMANDAIEKVRKSLRQKLTDKQRRGLMHDRFVLLKRNHELNDEQAFLLDGWCKNYPELGLAYQQKEAFFQIYEAQTKEEAAGLFVEWQRNLTPEITDAYADLVKAWNNWESYICNYFDHKITNAYTESLNNLIRVTNRLGRGYSFEALRAKILFSEGIYKLEQKKPKFKRRKIMSFSRSTSISWVDDTHQSDNSKDGLPVKPINYGVDMIKLTEILERDGL